MTIRSLRQGYVLLNKSRMVSRGDGDLDALRYFQSVLNTSQPSSRDDRVLYTFARDLFNNDKKKFIEFIRGTLFECLVLWTESKYISDAMGISGRANIKWTGARNMYSVTHVHNQLIARKVPPVLIHPLVHERRTYLPTPPDAVEDVDSCNYNPTEVIATSTSPLAVSPDRWEDMLSD